MTSGAATSSRGSSRDRAGRRSTASASAVPAVTARTVTAPATATVCSMATRLAGRGQVPRDPGQPVSGRDPAQGHQRHRDQRPDQAAVTAAAAAVAARTGLRPLRHGLGPAHRAQAPKMAWYCCRICCCRPNRTGQPGWTAVAPAGRGGPAMPGSTGCQPVFPIAVCPAGDRT